MDKTEVIEVYKRRENAIDDDAPLFKKMTTIFGEKLGEAVYDFWVYDHQWLGKATVDEIINATPELFRQKTTLYKTMQELTGKESGMLLFDNREYMICNWTQVNGVPRDFYTGLVGLGEEFEATPCEVPPEMIEAMQAHEVSQGAEPSKDGFRAWEIFEDEGFICTVAINVGWI